MLGSYHGQPFVVGQLSNLDEITNNTNAVEILSRDGIWIEKIHYPYSDGISKYGIASTNDSGNLIFTLVATHKIILVIVMGGRTADRDMGIGATDIVAQFKNEKWNQLGILNVARQGHRAILYKDRIMIVGGAGDNR